MYAHLGRQIAGDTYRYILTNIEIYRLTNRQTERQMVRHRQTNRDTDRQIDRQT